MKLIADKILIRITAELRNTIYSKDIVSSTGEVIKMWKAVRETDQMDERASFLNVQTAIVEDVSDKVSWIKKGDIALINYDICNSELRVAYHDGDDTVFFLEVNTTYHQEDEIAWQTQKSKRDQITHAAGEYNELSGLLGVIRNGELIANSPFVFLDYEDVNQTMVSPSGVMYEKQNKIIERKVIAISEESTLKFGVKKGDVVTVDDYDLFPVKIDEEHGIEAVNDIDILCR
jgi:co-chaperonin GroES (HSP10)